MSKCGFIIGLCLVGWTALVVAEPPDAQPGELSDKFFNSKQLEIIRLWHLVDKLEIDEEQAIKLFPAWSEFQRQQRTLGGRRKRVANELRRLLRGGGSSDEELVAKTAELKGLESEIRQRKQVFEERLEEVLSVRQRALWTLFDEGFRRDLREMLRAFREFQHRREKLSPPPRRENPKKN